MIAWRDLRVIGPDGEDVKDDEVRAAALALAFAEDGTVKVLTPSGDEVQPGDVAWHGVEATGAEPVHGRDDRNLWTRATIFARDLVGGETEAQRREREVEESEREAEEEVEA
jgi:hypothetical protein